MFAVPTQLVDYRCTLEARDGARNIARSYRIHASRDLFGYTIVTLNWGRIGSKGMGLTVSFADEDAARRFIQRTLVKRASARRRIGVEYQLVTGITPLPSSESTFNSLCDAHAVLGPVSGDSV